LLACTLFLTGAGGAHAAFAICRTDPTVTLSDGRTVTMSAEITADPSQVIGVAYVLHVPRDLTATTIAYDSFGYLESVSIVPDQKNKRFVVDTIVTTTTGADVTASVTISGDKKTELSHGEDSQTLTIKFRA